MKNKLLQPLFSLHLPTHGIPYSNYNSDETCQDFRSTQSLSKLPKCLPKSLPSTVFCHISQIGPKESNRGL